MRDPKRIDDFCNEFARLWREKVPDWRFTQLIMNFFGTFKSDPWYKEEDEVLQAFKEFLGEK